MDVSTIIVGVLALIGTLGGSYLTGTKTTAVIQEKINTLEEKVNKHNNLVERMYKVESDLKTAFIYIDEIREELEK